MPIDNTNYQQQGLDRFFAGQRAGAFGPFGQQGQNQQPQFQQSQGYNSNPSSQGQGGQNNPNFGALGANSSYQNNNGAQGFNMAFNQGFQGGTGPNGQAVSSGWDQTRDALLSDMNNTQAAANRQWNRLDSNNQGMGQVVGGVNQAVQNVSNQGANSMDQFGQMLMGPQGMGNFDKASQYAADAVQTQKDAAAQYKDTNLQTAQATASGISRNFQAQMQQINAGRNPDGSAMTPEQQESARSQIRSEQMTQVASAMAPLVTRGQEFLAGLKGNIAQTQMGAANMEAGIGQGRSNVLAMAQRSREFSANLRQMGVIQGAQLEMQGRGQLGQMIQANPETVVSKFQGLMAMFGADQQFGLSPGQNRPSDPNQGRMASPWDPQPQQRGNQMPGWPSGGPGSGSASGSGIQGDPNYGISNWR